ncbi:hypothetical protein ACFO6R_12645 [Eubacterium multiforme]|uniref:Uncharacterized protein n=1 Tax=Eubacterium multiforme TaxID=83339 RepID=A0ABT9UW92_9FIRM|nr:hypothetical protein [Eubacterium multiforme]MDQ0150582.1 hypothetical protein [Eubacterium multiforme]
MDNVPNRLECAYCIRHYRHGGECNGKTNNLDEKGCLVFKLDKKGCIRNKDFVLKIPLFYEVPLLNTWNNDWKVNGEDTEIRITKIYGLTWDKEKGYIKLHCNCDYYINEFSNTHKDNKKPILKIIK